MGTGASGEPSIPSQLPEITGPNAKKAESHLSPLCIRHNLCDYMDVQHPELIFGCATVGEEWPTKQSVQELLEALRCSGIDRIDTAASYPATNVCASERLLGEAGVSRQNFKVDTKILVPNQEASGSLQPGAVELSLQKSYEHLQLQGQKLHVLYCHTVDRRTPLVEQAAGLDIQYRKGIFDKVFQGLLLG